MIYFLRFFILTLIISSNAMTTYSSTNSESEGDYVLLIHGMAQSEKSMAKIASDLKVRGYVPIIVSYPSTKFGIEDLAKNFVVKEMKKLDPNRRVHIVGYSMGGIIARYIIDNYRPYNLGNVILIGTPNKGSEIAGFLEDYLLVHKIFGPALNDLKPTSTFWSKIKPNVKEYNVGVIAGDFSMNPFTSMFVFDGQSDGTVSLESAKIEGMKDFLIMNHSHYFLIKNQDVLKYIANFLQFGYFEPKV